MNAKQPNYYIEDAHRIYPFEGTKAFQGFEINECLYQDKSDYQDIAIYSNDALGRILVLDGIVQITYKDEFVYQEMMAHVPVFAHGSAKNILIIGGGDGGILREVLRHGGVENAVMAEIDQKVIDACIQYMPEINHAGGVYEDARTTLVVDDASKYIKETDLKFDVVIIDSTDPVGPGEKLFTAEFYGNVGKILNENAIVVTQGGVPLFQSGEAAHTLGELERAGLSTSAYLACVPTYYGGFMTLGYATNSKDGVELPALEDLQTRFDQANIETKYYSPAMHLSAFTLPPFIAQDVFGNKTAAQKKEAA